VRAQPHLTSNTQRHLRDLHARATAHLADWNVPDPAHQLRIDQTRADWARLTPAFQDLTAPNALETLWQKGQGASVDTQELLLSLLLEPFADLIDGLAECLTDPFGGTGIPFADTDALKTALRTDYPWALAIDFTDPAQSRRFWYVSEEKLEPRLGDRQQDPGADKESPLDIARRIQALFKDLPDASQPLMDFLSAHPEHLLAVERAQIMATHPYGEIQDNLIAQTCLPINMLRAKLACFGATRFDPKSDLWTRSPFPQAPPLPDARQPSPADSLRFPGPGF